MKIKIGWKNYEIQYKDEIINEESGRECYGQINYDDQVIELRRANTERQDVATVIHETLHGLDDMYGLDLNEVQTTNLANYITCMLFDNPLVVKALSDEVQRLTNGGCKDGEEADT